MCRFRGALVFVVFTLSTSIAHADWFGAPPPRPDHRYRFEANLGFEGYETWLPHAPRLLLQGSGTPRDLVGLVTPDASARFEGVGADFRAYGLPIPGSIMTLLHFRYAAAAGALPAGVERADGEPVQVRTESMRLLEFGIPWWTGMAFADADNRFKIAALFDTGAAYAWGTVLLRTSRGTTEQDMHRFDLYIHTEADLCARPLSALWLCAALTGNVQDFGWLNGGSVGLRVEIAP